MSDKRKTADQISQDINKPVKEPSSTGGNQVKPAMGIQIQVITAM